jgi:predicted nucleotidyltransferase
LREFLWRVDQVNEHQYYLGKVVSVVLFGSMLKPDLDRLSDVDLAVEVVPKEADRERARITNWQRVNDLEEMGRRFRGPLGRDFCWYWQVFEFLKGRGRVISLVDLRHEGEFVLAVPHKRLLCDGRWRPDAPPRLAPRGRYAALSEGDELF